MRLKTVFTLLFAVIVIPSFGQDSSSAFDRASFYDAISSEDLEKVTHQLNILKDADISEKEAFEGALLMKKAGLIKGLSEKLAVFKEGNELLENALSAHPDNTEYRFLRLVIQENAPKILGYNDHIQEDSAHIRQGYATLSSEVKKAIYDYSKESEFLHLEQVSGGAK